MPVIRAAEHLHSVKCNAAAMVAAIQNLAIQDADYQHDFRLCMQDNYVLTIVDDMQNNGAAGWSCICPDCQHVCCTS